MALLPDVLPAGPIELRRWRRGSVEAMAPAIAVSFSELRRWMPWAREVPTPAELRSVLEAGEAAFEADQEWDYTVNEPASDSLVGGAGLHRRGGPDIVDIGYWIRSDRTGMGYATAAAKALTDAAFTLVPGVERVEIHMDRANEASAAVPRKLGYRLDHEEVRPIEAPGHTGVGSVWVLDRRDWPPL
ncbi:MAG TPA: GNAT family N-acetyltransferase [Acidimicrobiales bacterium]|nr:GNAT family N-acetyltransferase [Acidimicrobiales bacterium]HLN41983.1 GNAT family N-acetyltransferase [Acidimicrobiales bacterium]